MSVSPISTIDVDAIRELFYPVGKYWYSDNSTNPGTIIGGTWEQVKDTFLLAAGDVFQAGSSGGEKEHILTNSEIPSHNHEYRVGYKLSTETTAAMSGEALLGANSPRDTASYNAIPLANTDNTGGGQPHNNMPPYKAVYVFRRIA